MSGSTAIRGLLVAALLASSGCMSAIRVAASHSELAPARPQHAGRIRVQPLEDTRLQQLRRFVGSQGNERAGSPPIWDTAILLDGDQSLSPLLTGYLADALRNAGYQPVLEPAASGGPAEADPGGPLLAGKIEVFWLNRGVFAIWHHVRLSLSLADDPAARPRWQRAFESRATRAWPWEIFFVDPSREAYEQVIRRALDAVLGEMNQAFASSEFYAQVRESETSARESRAESTATRDLR